MAGRLQGARRRRGEQNPQSDSDIRGIFIYLPKTASSSIRHSGLSRRFDALGGREFRLQHHYPGEPLVEMVRKAVGDSFFRRHKFSVVRNPWDRAVSGYEYCRRRGYLEEESFEEYLVGLRQNSLTPVASWHGCPQWRNLVLESGKPGVDSILRFENLAVEFRLLSKVFGVRAHLPHLNAGRPTDYRNYYNENARRMVWELYQEDIERFGYCF